MQVQQNKDKLWEAGFIFRGSESPEVRRKSLNKSSELAPSNAGLASWQVSGQQGSAQFHSLVGRRNRWMTVTKHFGESFSAACIAHWLDRHDSCCPVLAEADNS